MSFKGRCSISPLQTRMSRLLGGLKGVVSEASSCGQPAVGPSESPDALRAYELWPIDHYRPT